MSRRTTFLSLLLALAMAGCAGSSGAGTGLPSGQPAGSTGGSAAGEPTPGTSAARSPAAVAHVYLIVLENKSYDALVGSAAAPYFNQLADRYALATAYTGVAHPSQPNYLALFSGSTQGVTDDGVHDLTAPTLADQLEAAGLSWAVNAEHVPSGCFRGTTATGGPDGPGTYARKHEPAISFTSISGDPARCARIHDFSAFDPGTASFELIIPDLCHDMHDCSVATGDAWLRTFLPRLTGSAAWRSGAVLFITVDEGEGGANRVPTLVLASQPQGGLRSSRPHDHYGLLRTIEDLLGLPCLALSCGASPLTELLAP